MGETESAAIITFPAITSMGKSKGCRASSHGVTRHGKLIALLKFADSAFLSGPCVKCRPRKITRKPAPAFTTGSSSLSKVEYLR